MWIIIWSISLVLYTTRADQTCPNHCTCQDDNVVECCILNSEQKISEINKKCKKFHDSVNSTDRDSFKCKKNWKSLSLYMHSNSFNVKDLRSYDILTCANKLEELTITGSIEEKPRDNFKILNSETISSLVGSGSKLKKITISNIELHSIEDGFFHKMKITNLEHLIIKNNPYLKSLGQGSLTGSENLKILELQRNALSQIDLNSLGFYPHFSLQTLDLSGNQIENIEQEQISNFPGITLINLDNNKLTTLSAGRFRNLSSLKHLSLRNNRITELLGFLNEKSNNLTSLSVLDISGNPLFSKNSIPYWFRDGCPTNLAKVIAKNVSLDTSAIDKDSKLFFIKNCQSLREIDLSDNAFPKCLDAKFFGINTENELDGIKIKPGQFKVCKSPVTLPPITQQDDDPIPQKMGKETDEETGSTSETKSSSLIQKSNGPFYILLIICSLAFFVFLIFTIVVITCLRRYKKISNNSGSIDGGVKKILDQSRKSNAHFIAQGIPSVPSGFVTITPNELNESTIFMPTNEYNPSPNNGLIHHNDNEYLYATSMYNSNQMNRNSSPNETPSDEITPKDESNCSSSFNDSGFNQTMMPNSSTYSEFYKASKNPNLVTSVSTFFPRHQVAPENIQHNHPAANRPESICITSPNGLQMYSSMMSLNHLQLPNNTLPKSRTILHTDHTITVPQGFIPNGYVTTNTQTIPNQQRIYSGLVNMNGNVSHFYRQGVMSTSQDSRCENRVSIVL